MARSLGQASGDLSRRTLEALAIDGYRFGELSEEQVRRILGYGTRMQVHEFRKEHDVYRNYALGDLEQDLQTLRQVHERESARDPLTRLASADENASSSHPLPQGGEGSKTNSPLAPLGEGPGGEGVPATYRRQILRGTPH